jgi:hypothetical protein
MSGDDNTLFIKLIPNPVLIFLAQNRRMIRLVEGNAKYVV